MVRCVTSYAPYVRCARGIPFILNITARPWRPLELSGTAVRVNQLIVSVGKTKPAQIRLVFTLPLKFNLIDGLAEVP